MTDRITSARVGVTFDEAAAAKYPYERRYLDANRLKDGTLWDW